MACCDDCWDAYKAATTAAWDAHTARLLACTTNQCRIDSVAELKFDLNKAADVLSECLLDCFENEP